MTRSNGSASVDISPLWEPIQINGLEISNRVLVSSHTIAFDDDYVIPERYVRYYEERARGGVGLLITGAEGIHPTGWHPPHYQAWREDATPRYRALADAVHQHGSKIFTQLWHCGMQNHGTFLLDNMNPVFGPSELPSPVYGKICKAMEQEDIDTIVKAFAHAAALAQSAGIDGCEVAGAHGYLVNNFLSPLNNRRTDGYGGSLEKRCRFVIEVGEAIRERVGADFPLGLRLSFDGYIGPGDTEPGTAAQQLKTIHAAGVFDYYSISGGTYHTQWASILPASTDLVTPFRDNAALAKRTVNAEVPIMVAGGVSTVSLGAGIVASGDADMVAMTRAHIADPYLVRKAKASKVSEIRRCVGFNQGCVNRQALGGMSSCTVNPAVGREDRWAESMFDRADPQNVVVVGGGPAGMKFAETAARRGHRVTLIERDSALGGAVRHAAALPSRGRWQDFIDDLSGSMERLGVSVRLNETATAQTIRGLAPDLAVIATGSTYDKDGFSVYRSDREHIPGATPERVLDPVQVIKDPDSVGDTVVVIDEFAYNIGMGIAEFLGLRGKKVALVTIAPITGAWAPIALDQPIIVFPKLVKAGVEMIEQATITEITADTVEIAQIWTGAIRRLPAASLIMNMLRTGDARLYHELKADGVNVRRIGDAVAPRAVDEAVYEGMELGMEFDTGLPTYVHRRWPATAGVPA
jgi:2,4-dienoyl-CoA reductase-like NADH-dependent reductase (Old Yellow Enzyme family)